MKKQRSVVLKLSLITIGSFLVLFTIFIFVNSSILYKNSKSSSEDAIILATNKTASDIGNHFSKKVEILQSNAETLLTLKQNKQLTSDMLIEYKSREMARTTDTLGTAIIIEAKQLANISPEHERFVDEAGYFGIYLVRSGNDILIDPIEGASTGIWYTAPQQTKSLAITDPYAYEIDGQETSMITIAMPLLLNDTMIGVTVVDFTLDFIESIIAENIPASAIQRVATADGLIFTDSDNVDNVNKSLEQFVPDWSNSLNTLETNNHHEFYAQSKTFDEEAYSVLSPVKIDHYDKHLIVETLIPKSTILKMFDKVVKLSINAAIIIAVLLAALTYFFIHRSLKPLKPLQHALAEAASGTLTEDVPAQLLANDEIGAVGRAFNVMRKQVAEVIGHVSKEANDIEATSNTVNRGIEEISQSSLDMSTAINEVSKGAQFQASEIEAANIEMVKLGSKMDELSNVASLMLDYVENSNIQADKGKAEMNKLHVQSAQTNAGNEELVLQMSMLESQISQINGVMISIQGITEQTNLLALNASIEAARAGEYGKGFAVVADEVRKLAVQSKNETNNVQTIISNILRESEQTKLLAERNADIVREQSLAVASTEEAFNTQLAYAERIQQQIEELLKELNEMMLEKERVVNNMQSIAAVSEQSAASAEEISASAEAQYDEITKIVAMMNNLHNISTQLKEKTGFFAVR